MSAKTVKKEEVTPRSTLTHIGNWRLGPTLGRGAYGHVRLATHITGRQAACKILPALYRDPTKPVTWDQSVDAMEAHKEVVLLKALSGLKMPGVVELEGIVERDGWTYLFSTLHPHSAAQVRPPWPHDQLVTFFRRLCLTVHTLHLMNISHEDLKRSNVLVDPVGCPSLIDFGFSHFAAYGQRVRSAGGTLDYSSPEKVADTMYRGNQNDVWSLGILLTKIIDIPHPYINFDVDTESKAKTKLIEGKADFHFLPHHQGGGKAASLICQMLEPDPRQRITIPEILEHPFLTDERADPAPFHIPSYDLPSKYHYNLSPSVIQDICFLAYLNQEFALCQTSKDIVERLYGPEPCWEKRWAKMLRRWKKREDMEWEDIPASRVEAPKPRVPARSFIPVPVRSQVPGGPKRAVLRDIAPISRINAGNAAPYKATALPSPTPKAKHAHGSMIPCHDSPPGKLNIFSRAKRTKKTPGLPGLSPQKGMLPVHDKENQPHAGPSRSHASPKKNIERRSPGRSRLPIRPHRKHRGASLLSDDSVPQQYPVLRPNIAPSNLISLDEAVATTRQFNTGQHPLAAGDLLGDSVEEMKDLALDSSRMEDSKPAPRRSSRIAQKTTSRLFR